MRNKEISKMKKTDSLETIELRKILQRHVFIGHDQNGYPRELIDMETAIGDLLPYLAEVKRVAFVDGLETAARVANAAFKKKLDKSKKKDKYLEKLSKMSREEFEEELIRVGWGRVSNDPDAGVGGHKE